jgi:hypothetical protein
LPPPVAAPSLRSTARIWSPSPAVDPADARAECLLHSAELLLDGVDALAQLPLDRVDALAQAALDGVDALHELAQLARQGLQRHLGHRAARPPHEWQHTDRPTDPSAKTTPRQPGLPTRSISAIAAAGARTLAPLMT